MRFSSFNKSRFENDVSFYVAVRVFFGADDVGTFVDAPILKFVFVNAVYVAANGGSDFCGLYYLCKRFAKKIALDYFVVIFIAVVADADKRNRR